MKQIVIISGKGGTGKTVFAGAIAGLIANKVIVDCDVDVPDLHLLLDPKIQAKHIFKSGYIANIDQKKCIKCGQCRELCRFNAVCDDFTIDPLSCEGCGFCYNVCPKEAINMLEKKSGEWFVSNTRHGIFVHAKLGIAESNSGKLVSLIRKEALKIAEREKYDWIIIDGSPGIGCPVIASLANTDCAVIINEPTLSGLHDAKRVMHVAKHFKVPVKMVINKYDLNDKVTKKIEDYCFANGIKMVGKIPFEKEIIDLVINKKTIMDSESSYLKKLIIEIWSNIILDI